MAYAVNINGSIEKVYAPLDSTFDPTQPWTLEAWILLGSTGSSNNSMPALGFKSTTSSHELCICIVDNARNPILFLNDGSDITYTIVTDTLTSSYEHLRLVWDGTDIKLLINETEYISIAISTLAPSGSSAFMADFSELYAGNGSLNSNFLTFTGNVDDIRLWQTSAVTADINSALAGTETDLYGYYKLDEGTGSTAIDDGPYSQDGTVIGTYTTNTAIGSGGSTGSSLVVYEATTLIRWEVQVDRLLSDGTITSHSYSSDGNSGNSKPAITKLKMIVRGDGACVEGTFEGKPSELDIQPRDVLTFTSTHDDGSGGTATFNLFKGYIVKNGLPETQEVRTYKMVGLKDRYVEQPVGLNSVTGFDSGGNYYYTPGIYYAKDAANMAVDIHNDYSREILGVLPSSDIPVPINFELGDRIPNYQPANEYLDDLASSVPELLVPTGTTYLYNGITYNEGELVPATSWGVKGDGTFFFKRVDGLLNIDANTNGVEVKWQEVDSEEVISKTILVFDISNSDDVSLLKSWWGFGSNREEYSPLYPSISYEDPKHDIYKATKVIPFSVRASGFISKADSSSSSDIGGSWLNLDNLIGDDSLYTSNDAPRTLCNYGLNPNAIGYSPSDEQIGIEFKYEALAHPRDKDSELQLAVFIGDTSLLYSIDIPADGQELRIIKVFFAPSVHDGDDTDLNALAVILRGDFESGESDIVRIYYSKLLYAKFDDLQDVGKYYIKLPASNPADITIHNKWYAPKPKVELTKLDGTTLTVPAETYEYTMDSEKGIHTLIKLEQDLDADSAAQRALLNRKSDKAVDKSRRYSKSK